jgi:hypothetical protein
MQRFIIYDICNWATNLPVIKAIQNQIKPYITPAKTFYF